MTERRHPLARCEECPLNQPENGFAPTEFAENTKVVVVGEGPGFQETAYRRPFAGPSGRLIRQVMQYHGFKKDEVTYTNACLCRPPGNATPPKTAINACRGRLLAEIDGTGSKNVVALGNTAASALLDDSRTISHLRVGPAKEPTKALSHTNVEAVVATWHPAYCTDPSNRILKADLTWIRAGDVQVDDEFIGFDEYVPTVAYGKREFKKSIVTNVERLILDRYVIKTKTQTITVSADHMWLVQAAPRMPATWRQTKDLKASDKLLLFVEPWEQDNTFEAGYLSGFLDGEASLSKANGIVWGQNGGEVADKVVQLFEGKGFEVGTYAKQKCNRYALKGKRESLRALGILRPVRLLPKAEMLWEGLRTTYAMDIESITPIGPGEVVSIATTTKTFILEGYLSHNCLRTADAFPSLVSDIGKLKEGRREPWRDPEWESIDDPLRAREVIAELRSRSGPLVIDIEVGIEKDAGFDHPNEYDLLCVGLADSARQAYVFSDLVLRDPDVRDQFKSLLVNKKLIAHNGKFDLAGLYPTFGGLKLWFDTMLAHYALDERPGHHALKYLGVELLGTPKWDDEIKRYIPRRGNYADIPRPILYKYNALDVAATYALYEMFSKALDAKGLRRVHDHLVAASNELMYLELNGVPVDIPYNFQLGDAYQERIQALEAELDGIVSATTNGAITAINARSPKQIKEYFDSQGISTASTDVDSLTVLLGRVGSSSPTAAFMRTLLKHRREQKLYGTYVEGIRKRVYRGRVYTTYLLHGTTSGRLASRNPNLQNIVRDKAIRRQFVASKAEHVLVQADYKNAELRVMAHESDDPYLLEILSQSGIDLFDSLCDQIYGVGTWNKEGRVRIKAFVYGLAYGREAPSIAAEFKMPLGEAYELRDKFLSLIPGIVSWQGKIRDSVLRGEDLVTWFGRRRRFHLITEQNKREVLNEALSYVPQSTASDITLSALIRLRPMLKGLGFLRLTIHDALVVECHSDRRDEVSHMLQSVMEEEGRKYTTKLPFTTDVSYGASWGEL